MYRRPTCASLAAKALAARLLQNDVAHALELLRRRFDAEEAAEGVGEVRAQRGGAGEGADEHDEELKRYRSCRSSRNCSSCASVSKTKASRIDAASSVT